MIATERNLQLEPSVEETATFLGVQGMSIVTYRAHTKPDGRLSGEGEGVFASPQGRCHLERASVSDGLVRTARSNTAGLSASQPRPRSWVSLTGSPVCSSGRSTRRATRIPGSGKWRPRLQAKAPQPRSKAEDDRRAGSEGSVALEPLSAPAHRA
jgi:hypothetical protein